MEPRKDNFKTNLFKMKLSELKNPEYFKSKGSVLIKVESQVVSRFRLNEETYTGFIEFTRRNCGAKFVKDFATGMVDVKVLDVAGSNGLYSFVEKRGFYFKNSNGYDGTSGALGIALNWIIQYDLYYPRICLIVTGNLVCLLSQL